MFIPCTAQRSKSPACAALRAGPVHCRVGRLLVTVENDDFPILEVIAPAVINDVVQLANTLSEGLGLTQRSFVRARRLALATALRCTGAMPLLSTPSAARWTWAVTAPAVGFRLRGDQNDWKNESAIA
jgi:hypothetical protein